MRFVTWLRPPATRPASPRPRPAARPRATLHSRLETLGGRQLLNARTAFDATGNPLRQVVDNAGKRTETYPGQTAQLAAGVLRAHACRDSDGSIGITVVNQRVNLTIPGEVLRYNGRPGARAVTRVGRPAGATPMTGDACWRPPTSTSAKGGRR